jgi:hypothetical protein
VILTIEQEGEKGNKELNYITRRQSNKRVHTPLDREGKHMDKIEKKKGEKERSRTF